jgi:hypothetical protein
VSTCDIFSRADKYLILNNLGIRDLELGTDDVFSRADQIFALCLKYKETSIRSGYVDFIISLLLVSSRLADVIFCILTMLIFNF